MSSDRLSVLSNSELLGGRITKRASLLLFLIESRTAHLVVQMREVVAPYVSDKAEKKIEHAFLDDLAQVRNLPVKPTIQDIERFARVWDYLVPPDVNIRAVLAHMLGEKYIFTHGSVPLLRKALALDDHAVKQAYQLRYDQPLANIYAPDVSRLERLRWVWTRLAYRIDNLPPFWLVFFLTLTEAVGACILALPIAMAGMGALPGMVLVVGLGLINILTIAALSEAVARNGNVRYGSAYFGRLIADYLGNAGYWILILAFLGMNVTVFIAYGVGVAVTVADVTGVPAAVLPLLLLVVDVYFLVRQLYSATVASSLVLGGITILSILAMALLALPHIRSENLLYSDVPFLNGKPFEPSSMSLVFGVILWVYFGFTTPVGAARLVLHRDPGGRSLIRGAVAAMVVAMAFNCLWVIAVNGTVAPATLAAQTGTGLSALAVEVGPSITVLGLVVAVLGMGTNMISYSLAVFGEVGEWLSDRTDPKDERKSDSTFVARIGKLASSPRGQFILGVIPVILMFGVVEWLLVTKQESFADPLSFLGTLTLPLLAGVFPVLILAASRRKGDYAPASIIRWLGHPVVVIGLYSFFLFSLLIHSLVVWQDPFQRLAAFIAGVLMFGMTIVAIRRGAFTRRCVIEVRVEKNPEEQMIFNVTVSGKPAAADLHFNYADREERLHASTGAQPFADLQSVNLQMLPSNARELKVWVHRATREAESVALPVRVAFQSNGETINCELTNRQAVLPIPDRNWQLQIAFEREAPERESMLDQI